MFPAGHFQSGKGWDGTQKKCGWDKKFMENGLVRNEETDWYNIVATPVIETAGIPILHIWRPSALLNGTENEAEGHGDCTHYQCIGSAVALWSTRLASMIGTSQRRVAKDGAFLERWRALKRTLNTCRFWEPPEKQSQGEYKNALEYGGAHFDSFGYVQFIDKYRDWTKNRNDPNSVIPQHPAPLVDQKRRKEFYKAHQMKYHPR
jgi:hypothetical protein